MILRNFLNKLIWDSKSQFNRENTDILYIHRGAPDSYLKINYTQIMKVNSDSFEYYDKFRDEKKRIPFHRIERIFEFKINNIFHQKIKGVTQICPQTHLNQ